MGKRATISDLALLAGVSKSTVSRALNDNPLISKETRERIQDIARANNFYINASARQLSLRESQTVAFVTHGYHKDFSIVDLFTLEIMGGVSRGLHEQGYDMLVIHVDPGDKEWAREYLDSGRVAGFILITSERKQDQIRELNRINAPFIIWGVPNEKNCCSSICGDNYTGGFLATNYLIQQGRKQIGFIGGPANEREMQLRLEGYQAALMKAGISPEKNRETYGDFSPMSGYRAMNVLLDNCPELNGVVVASDLMAFGAIKSIQDRHLTVPGQISVIGYDDLSIAQLSTPPLTTIRQNIPDAGHLLAKSIVNQIKTGEIQSTLLPVSLIIRESA
jgi:DNA-binding LacI/PurR family transcriptional regulator